MDRNLNARCGELISLIGRPDFGRRFRECFSSALDVDQCTVFLFDDDKAEAVVAESRTDGFRHLVHELSESYVETGFKGDPMRTRIGELQSGAAEVLTLNPDELQDPEYRAQFYDRPNIRQELALLARFGGQGLYVAFYREHRSSDFTPDDAGLLESLTEPTIQVLKKHVEFAGCNAPMSRPQQPADRIGIIEEQLRAAMLDDCHGLTPREAEVCVGIVLGYTVLGISSNLGITANTVATHRKRAYAKMQISSQNELFSKYFDWSNRLRASM